MMNALAPDRNPGRLLAVLQSYAPAAWEREFCAGLVRQMEAGGEPETAIVQALAGGILDGLRDGSWPWSGDRLVAVGDQPAVIAAARLVARNAYGTSPRHARARSGGGCRDDCTACGLSQLRQALIDHDKAAGLPADPLLQEG